MTEPLRISPNSLSLALYLTAQWSSKGHMELLQGSVPRMFSQDLAQIRFFMDSQNSFVVHPDKVSIQCNFLGSWSPQYNTCHIVHELP